MKPRRRFVQFFILLLLPLPVLGAEKQPLFPILESGIGELVVGSRRAPLEYSITAVGALVSLAPLISSLGGELTLGPMREYHRLSFGDGAFVFGPGSLTMTVGEEIVDLAQPPVMGAVGLQVPVDLLRQTYGRALGYEFRWDRGARSLEVFRQPPREIPVSVDAVRLQGVTTLVFEFREKPRYRLRRAGRRVEIETVGDTLRPLQRRPFPADALVKDVRLRGSSILIDLAPGAVAEEYVLDAPFRLVFDVHRSDAPLPAATPSRTGVARLPRDGSGIDTIVLDPGHGGSDTGAQGPGGSLEKNLTLILARTVERRLEDRLPVRVVLTRDDDDEISLDARAAVANQYKAALFVSLHLNSALAATAQGAETYFLSLEASDERAAAAAAAENRSLDNRGDPAGGREEDPLRDLQLILWDLAQTHHLAESQRLAAIIQEELNLALNLRNRGVKQAPFRVLMGAAMPAVLVELGFLTDPEEERRLNDPEYRSRLADTLVRAIVRYRAARAAEVAGPVETPR